MRRAWMFPVLAAALALLAVAAGCGEKITVPQPRGLFSISAYTLDTAYDDDQPLQVAEVRGNILVLTAGSLKKRTQTYEVIGDTVPMGPAGPTAMCVGPDGDLVFVCEQGASRIAWFDTQTLLEAGSYSLPDSFRIAAMTANAAGIGLEPGARFFLYMSDPEMGVVHRYVFDDFGGLSPYGILARSNGDAARFVHVPAGLTSDSRDSLLVCDADPARNWVIRFNAVPDTLDRTPLIFGQQPWRGHAALIDQATCVPPAAADYVLGDAAACNESGWVGGVSDAEGAFAEPRDCAVDGSGRIFVADTGNDRVQVFSAVGEFDLQFGNAELSPGPVSLDVIDVRVAAGESGVHYGAYVFVVVPEANQVRKFISSEHYIYLNQELPPPPN